MSEVFIKINEILSKYSKGEKNNSYKKLKKLSAKYPNNEKIKFNLAIMEQDQGFINSAKASYINLIERHNNFNAKMKLYLILISEQDYYRALEIIDIILKDDPTLEDVLLDKAYVQLKTKNLKECYEICNSVILKDHKNIKAINLLGQFFIENKNYKEAEKWLLEGISYEKNNIAILNALAKLYFETWDLNKSEKYYQKAIECNAESYQTLNNLAGFYLETNNSIKALNLYEKALNIFPNEATILNNISKTYLSLGKINEAKKHCLLALKKRNDDSFKKILSIIYFRDQDFKNGWRFFDGRLGLNEFVERNSSYKIIKNKLLLGKKINPNKNLLIIREQGVGDEILYGTIYEDLLKKYNNVIIETDKRLIPLFVESFNIAHKNKFVELGYFSNNIDRLSKFEQILYAGSLGYYFRNNIDMFPKNNYLKIPEKNLSEGKKILKVCKKKYKIGISWKSFKNLYSNQKSLNLNNFSKIINNVQIDCINLQYGDINNELLEFNNSSETKIITLNDVDLLNDFLKVGSILKNIDLFVTVSNSTAHLAGALGVKTLLIKPINQATFHYWNQPTSRTPWYQNIELIDREILKNNEKFTQKIISKLT